MDRTTVNTRIASRADATSLNAASPRTSRAGAADSTAINSGLAPLRSVRTGAILCDGYAVVEKMKVSSGEADLYLCKKEGDEYVAKVYRREEAIKPRIAKKLRKIQSPYVARTFDVGSVDGRPVEIIPYYPLGSLRGRTFTYEQLKERIVPSLNEGLKILHGQGIIHKDLKPSNIMDVDGAGSVAIIDFGISSILEDGDTVIVTQTGMTPQYTAPEALRGNLFHEGSDYYSLGMTICELYSGRTPYEGMSPEEMSRYISMQRLPLPGDMPDDLKNLIRGLTYIDISNRGDRSNPNRRWEYEEVANWLKGVEQLIPGEGASARRSESPYAFKGSNYTSRCNLVRALAENWVDGKKELFRGKLSRHFEIIDDEAFEVCQRAERSAREASGMDDEIFWVALRGLAPDMSDFFWKGKVCSGLPALGRDLLESLRGDDQTFLQYMDDALKAGIISKHATACFGEQSEDALLALNLEKIYSSYHDARGKRMALYLAAYRLSGQNALVVRGCEYHTLGELVDDMRTVLGENHEHIEDFKDFCHCLADSYDSLTPAFEAWLIALGKHKEISRWRETMKAF